MIEISLGAASVSPAEAAPTSDSILHLAGSGSGPAMAIAWVLIAAAVTTWALLVIKARQLARLRKAELAFEAYVDGATQVAVVHEACRRNFGALGARLTERVLDSVRQADDAQVAVERATTREAGSVHAYMTTLATIGATAPFVGLLGTVYGILDAFLRIGSAGSASLSVVAPAIGEALVATALGLFAAIPAVVGYNYLSRGVDDLLERARANAKFWAVTLAGGRQG